MSLRVDRVALRRDGHGVLEDAARAGRGNVVDDERRRLAQHARVGDEGRGAVVRDGERLQVGTQWCDLAREAVLVTDFATDRIEGEQPRGLATVVAVIKDPEPAAAVERDTERRVQELLLRRAVRERRRDAVAQAQQLVAEGPRRRVHGEEQVAVGRNRDAADGFGVLEHDLGGRGVGGAVERELGVGAAAAVDQAHDEQQGKKQGREAQQHAGHSGGPATAVSPDDRASAGTDQHSAQHAPRAPPRRCP